MIGVVARIKVKADQIDAFKGAFSELMGQVKANEPGNKLYDLFQAKDDPTQFVVMEIYESQEALSAHGASAHFRAAGPKLGPCLEGAPKVEYFDKV